MANERSKNKSGLLARFGRSSKTDVQEGQTVAGNGTVVQSHAAGLGRAVAYAALLLAIVGGLAGILSFVRADAPAQGAPAADRDDSASQQAGDYARSFTGAWLRSSADDYQQLTEYVAVESGDITDSEPHRFRDLSVASVHTEGDISTVIVSAQVSAPAADQEEVESEAQARAWETTWYQVNVHARDGNFSAMGYPAPVPPPQSVEAPDLAYGERPSDEVTGTVGEFFDTYLVGEGDVDRVIHPDSEIEPVEASLYDSVKVLSVTTVEDHRDEVPVEGTQAQVRAEIELVSATGARPASYSLTLESRGGRWEVLTVDASPQLELSQSAGEDMAPTQSPAAPSGTAANE